MKRFDVWTFMSWENEGSVWNKETKRYDSDKVRAIALCYPNGYFIGAINCLRDGDMGEKDENGVYDRVWWADYIDCYGNERETLRPANSEEVELYKKYCSVEGTLADTWQYVFAEITDESGTHVILANRCKLSRMFLIFYYHICIIIADVKRKIRFMKFRWKHRNSTPEEIVDSIIKEAVESKTQQELEEEQQ